MLSGNPERINYEVEVFFCFGSPLQMAVGKKMFLASILLGNEYLRAKIALLEVWASIT